MTRDDVQRWLDRYIAAWAADDTEAIGDLFTTDARYRFHPSDAGFVGRDAIVRSWLQPDGDASTRDEPGTWDAHYEPFVVGGEPGGGGGLESLLHGHVEDQRQVHVRQRLPA